VIQGDFFRINDDPALDRIRTLLEEQRGIHPELRRPVTWNGLRAILRRLGIPIVMAPMVRPAALLSQLGASVLLLDADTPPRRHTYFVAHELAHFWLHADEPDVPVYHYDACYSDDPREDDAEILATLMLGGPRFSRHF
jgi:Zn-dependent peptidase ImmA (M78 family)